MRTIAVLLVLLFVAAPASASDLIGRLVPPYPAGMASDMGTCIASKRDPCGYSIGTLNDAQGKILKVMALALSKRLKGVPVWRVIDIRDAPALARQQMWALEECAVDGKIDPTIIGAVSYRDMGGWIETKDTIWAIRFDVAAGRLEDVKLATVSCTLPGS